MHFLVHVQAEIEAHAQSGSVSIYVHYGSNRLRDVKALLGHDVVLTTYGVLSSSFHSEVGQ
jgi:DNA repair protein RAD5